jgi:hypothetical protein
MRGWINTSGRLGSAECESERLVHVCTRIYAGIQCFSFYGVDTSRFIDMPRSRRGRSAILVRPPNPLNAESLHAVCRKLTRTEASCPPAGLLHLFLLLLLHRRRDLLTHAFPTRPAQARNGVHLAAALHSHQDPASQRVPLPQVAVHVQQAGSYLARLVTAGPNAIMVRSRMYCTGPRRFLSEPRYLDWIKTLPDRDP